MKAALAQDETSSALAELEVVGERCIDGGKCHHECKDKCFRRECCEPLSDYVGSWSYFTPPQRTWVDLTDKELSVLYEDHHDKYNIPKGNPDGMDYERAIAAKLKEKNT